MRLILSILMLGAVVAGFVWFIVPRYNAIVALRVQKEDYNTILDNARKLEEQRDKLIAKYNAFDQGLLQKLNVMLPVNPENVKLILAMDAAAERYGLILQNVKIEDASASAQPQAARPGTTPQNTEIGSLKINFSITGSYVGFTNFLRAMETSLRIVDIQKITFSASDDTRQSYQYTVGLKTYWLK